MATHKSAIKRVRQNKRRNLRNRMIRSAMKTYMKKVLMAVEKKELQNAEESLKKASSFILKAASKGVIHKNTASRRISRLARKVNALKT